jgi:alanine dehydrogenase
VESCRERPEPLGILADVDRAAAVVGEWPLLPFLYRPAAMRIGVAREIKQREYRVALTPAGALELVQRGHEVTVEHDAGAGSGFADDAYTAVGARIAPVDEVWSSAELLLKVKEPIAEEYGRLREDLTLFTYLHIAADEPLTDALLASGITGIAYETVETPNRHLPLLAPMSEVAGRLAPQMGAWSLEKAHGGRGILLGGVPGVPPAKVVILGGGVVGLNSAIIALGMQADVWVLDKSVERMRDLEIALDGRVTLAMSNRLQIEEILADADMVIGAVLVPGAVAPKLVTREMLGLMRPGAVLVDVAIDQGGCFETSHATTHDDPVFEVDGIVHYCVANMPGAVPVTSTKALTNVTLPYVEAIADKGVARAIAEDAALAKGVNVVGGKITYEAVAQAHGLSYTPLADAISAS